MGLLTRFRRPQTQRLDLRWETIAASDTVEHPGLIAELLDRRRDGITITGVMTPDEIEHGLEALEGVERLDRPFGWLLGMAIGMLGADDPRSGYYADADQAKRAYEQAFGFDVHQRVADVMGPLAPGMPMVAPTEGDDSYNPGQIRWWEPGQGGLPAHAGNEFREQLADGAMRHLLTTTAVQDHLSYFVVLQRADRGGALSVYDLIWEPENDPIEWDDCTRNDGWIDAYPSTKFDLAPGDMVLFGGGWRWHKVDPPEGSKPRITYGGFAAPSLDGSSLNFWA